MKDNADKFLGCAAWAAVVYLLALILVGMCSCKLTRDVQKSSTDSASVKKEETTFNKIDTSKSTKEADRVTFIYPVDTTVNNFYTYPSTVIYEKVKETKQDGQSVNYENRKTDTVYVKTESKEVESKTKLGPSTIEWILIGLAALVVLRLLKKWEIL